METKVAVLIVMCFLLCLTFNYTLPLQRGNKKWSLIESYNRNRSKMCNSSVHSENVMDRSKKMVNYIENAIKKIKDSTQDIGKNIHDRVNIGKRFDNRNTLSEEDLRQYEQLVIMKKYPYLDVKEFQLKYSPSSNKNIRQSVNFASGSNIDGDPSLCESIEEGPSVEISNRGLSGFSIPGKLSKNIYSADHDMPNINLKSSETDELINLGKSNNLKILPEHSFSKHHKVDIENFINNS